MDSRPSKTRGALGERWQIVPGWRRSRLLLAPCGLCVGGCQGPQSTFGGAGRDAASISEIFWWMAAGAVLTWLVVMGLAIWAVHAPHDPKPRDRVRLFFIGGGAVVPTLVLVVLLVFGLRTVPALLNPGAGDGVRIHVLGEQWWWRVRYEFPDGRRFELANELHLPVGKRVPLRLQSADVVHAFWVPSLAGKVDLIPGRVTRLGLEPLRTGRFRGVCAEFCGLSHADMRFDVIVEDAQAFEAWADGQGRPAQAAGEVARSGERRFTSLGCGACHRVRGTRADGVLGPDLTHLASRTSLGWGAVNDRAALTAWLRSPHDHKPGAHMPAFDMLSRVEMHELVTYLRGLR